MLLTAKQLSKELGLSTHYIYRLSSEGLIPSHRIGKSIRFSLSEILEETKQDQPKIKSVNHSNLLRIRRRNVSN